MVTLERHRRLIAAAKPADIDGLLLGLAHAANQDHRHLGQRMLADLVVDLLVAEVGLDLKPGIAQLLRDLAP
jgi:hypothetical protein